jgi:hypothetical protein
MKEVRPRNEKIDLVYDKEYDQNLQNLSLPQVRPWIGLMIMSQIIIHEHSWHQVSRVSMFQYHFLDPLDRLRD